MSILTASTLSAVLGMAAAIPQVSAQSLNNAPMTSGGTVVEYGAGYPTGQRGQYSGLPGVDLNDGIGEPRRRGPGGLENNVGAIGMALPSTSSSNPQPLQDDRATRGGGLPISR
ncbi:hypothetical protein FP2506_08686 [Fulvimarina pelagi HTCC2506]|uniref:Curli production assembly/transport component CsgF n=2 Tax=Fulvimarina pelagi TaxID=217511 RepID=Q0G609_9HYPH|nr:hypothetical protein FP2506_08686 [Fulvimarina pelagi HTCC2506]